MMVKQAGVGAKGVAKSPTLVWRGASNGLISFLLLLVYSVTLGVPAQTGTHQDPRMSTVWGVRLCLDFTEV